MKVAKQNLADRLIGWISPKTGLDRLRYRSALSTASGYAGARRDRNVTVNWRGAAASADADTLPDLDELRGRSRDLVRNDPIGQSSIATKVTNVIGAGHMVRPEIDAERLRMTPDQARAWEREALDIWTDWAGCRDCDITRVQTFGELEDLVFRSRLLSGDVFVVRRFKRRAGRLLATAVQVVEADRISNPHWRTDSDDIAGGIEFDEDGAAVAYHVADRYVLDRGLKGSTTWQRIPAYGARGEWLVLHVHNTRWRPDMSRYAPMLAPVITSLKQRSEYTEAELQAAVVSACFAIAMTSEGGDLSEGLKTSGSGGSETKQEIRLTDPGTVFDLLPGESVQSFAPGRPSPQFTPFIEAVAQEVGAGTDLPYELLLKKFQASYSASRAALEMAWQFFRVDRAQHVAQFCRPVYEAVISEAVARGLIAAPGFFDNPLMRQAYLRATWMGPARISIDPVKDAKADREYLDMGATSLTAITAARFGLDHRDVRKRRQEDGSEAVGASGSSGEGPDEEDDDDTSDTETAPGARHAG
ncbi:phage portal protein [Ruegeria sp. PBVC088]|nr:phage portal protein [Ruegeria sp. PBVC088]